MMEVNSKNQKILKKLPQVQQIPDGGWGWLIVITSFFVLGNFFLVYRCYSVIFTYLMEEFDTDLSEVSWLSGLLQLGYGISCPLTPILLNHFSYRRLTMLTSLLAATSIATGSFQPSLTAIHICCGLIPGLCMGPIMICSFTVCYRYFDKYRNLATQLVFGGATAITFFICPAIQYLIDEFSWRGAMLLIAGSFLQNCITGASLKPITIEEDLNVSLISYNKMDHNNNKNDLTEKNQLLTLEEKLNGKQNLKLPLEVLKTTEEEKAPKNFRRKLKMFIKKHKLNVFANRLFYLYSFSYLIFSCGYISCLIYLIPHAKKIGLTDLESSTLLSSLLFGELFSRLINGVMLNYVNKQTRVLFIAVYIGLLSFAFLFVYLVNHYIAMMVACLSIGLLGGSLDGSFSMFISDAFGLNLYPAVFGYGNVIIHVGGMICTVTVGKLLDMIGDISAAFLIGIVSSLLSSSLVLVMRYYYIKQQAQNKLSFSEKRSRTSQM